MKSIVELGTNSNCSGPGNACDARSRCSNFNCCRARGCEFATCDDVDDGCGASIACGVCSAADTCVGHQCFPVATQSTAAENNATGELSVIASNQYDVEVQAQFVTSKGAYASAMVMSPRNSAPMSASIGEDDHERRTSRNRKCVGSSAFAVGLRLCRLLAGSPIGDPRSHVFASVIRQVCAH